MTILVGERIMVMNEQVETCPYCRQIFRAPEGHDPLRKHIDFCKENFNAFVLEDLCDLDD